MKPYFKVLYNKIKFLRFKIFQRVKIVSKGIQILGYNTKISMEKASRLSIGDRVISDGRCTIVIGEYASVSIGDKVYFNEGAMISAKSTITIEEGCQFGPNVKLFDNDHCFSREDGVLLEHKSAPIHIGKHSWIGANAVILRGTTIGKNCVIGAGCVVKGDVPDCSLVTMDRSLVIRQIEEKI